MKKKMLFVVSTLNSGGAQRILSNIIMSLPKEWKIDILLNDTENITYPYRGRIISLGVKPETDKTKLFYQYKVFAKRIAVLSRLKRKNGYTVCISALTSANVANVMTGGRKCRTVLTVHSFMSKNMLAGIKRRIIKNGICLFYNKADCVICVSRGIKKDLMENFNISPSKLKVIYNGYRLEDIRLRQQELLSDEEKGWMEKGPVLVTAGRLTVAKGQWHLVRALQKIKTEFPGARLLILGEGELKNYLKDLAIGCGIEKDVIFCGFLPNPYKILKECDVFILPSLYEGFGNVIIESLCCGTPCVATDFDAGSREILAPDTDMNFRVKDKTEEAKYGILCPVCDGRKYASNVPLTKEENLLADAVAGILRDGQKSRYYHEIGQERAEDFNMKNIITQWLEVIEI